MPAVDSPSAATICQNAVDRPRNRGRTTAVRIPAAARNRSAPCRGSERHGHGRRDAAAVCSDAQFARMYVGPTSRGAAPAKPRILRVSKEPRGGPASATAPRSVNATEPTRGTYRSAFAPVQRNGVDRPR